MSQTLQVVLKTTFALIEQFQVSLSTTQPNPGPATSKKENQNLDPLPLLSASSTALKSHVTKLSLLAINFPFTPSAVAKTLSTLNESVLPSLVTAALLVTPESHTRAFQSEIRVLTGTALKELSLLVKEVQLIAEEKADKKSLEQAEKDAVTAVAGRIWDACDVLVDVAAKGVVGFVVRRAQEYRDLVRDAVEEIEEWDPDEEGDEFFDDLLDDGDKYESGSGDEEDEGSEDGESSAALHARKKSALRILKPIAQIYPALIASRLEKVPVPLAPSNIGILESVLKNLQQIPDHIDEVAGALYEADHDKFRRRLRKTKESAFNAIELVVLPWDLKQTANEQENQGDKFTAWSKTWTKVVEEVSKSIDV